MSCPQFTSTATGTMPFEVGARSLCNRARSLRGRPQQCARVAGRHSSSARFGSRGSSAARSRSSTGSQRPSAEVELRSGADTQLAEAQVAIAVPVVDTLAIDKCATGFISGLLDNAVEDMAIELDYFTADEGMDSPMSSTPDADHVLSAAEPAIIEEADEHEEMCTTASTGLSEEATDLMLDFSGCLSEDEESDGVSCCDFNSDVCSIASANPEGAEDIDDFLVASSFAQFAVSDDVIEEAFLAEEAGEGAECVQFVGESPACGDEAFTYINGILGGAFDQATSTWQKQQDDENKVSSPAISAMEVLKEKAKQSLLKAVREKGFAVDAAASPDTHLASLKQKAREVLLKAAQAKAAEKKAAAEAEAAENQMQQLRLQVQKAFSKKLQSGDLSNVFAGALQQHDDTHEEDVRRTVQQTLANALASGKLASALSQVVKKVDTVQESINTEKETAAKLKVQQALSKGLHNGELTKAVGAALQQDKWNALQNKMKQNLSRATATGALAGALTQVMPKIEDKETEQIKTEEAVKLKVQQALAQGLKNGTLVKAVGGALQQDKWKDLQNKMRQNLSKAIEDKETEQIKTEEAVKLKVQQALAQGLKNGTLAKAVGGALQQDKWRDLQNKMRENLSKATASGKLVVALTEVVPEAVAVTQQQEEQVAEREVAVEPALTETSTEVGEATTLSTGRRLSSSRSHRRIIGGVQRSPVAQQENLFMPSASPSGSMRKQRAKTDMTLSAKSAPVTFSLDLGAESGGEENAKARESSLTRTYDTLGGAQFYNLGSDEVTFTTKVSTSAPTMSKTRARLNKATSMSAMDMDLSDTPVSSRRSSSQVSSDAFRQSFAPMPLNMDMKQKTMGSSSSLPSLSSGKLNKYSSGGFLPTISLDRKSAESMSWAMQVSKTPSHQKWGSTGLRGSASMIF